MPPMFAICLAFIKSFPNPNVECIAGLMFPGTHVRK